MGDDAIWSMVHDLRDRMVRQEERSVHRDEKIEAMDQKIGGMDKKLDGLVDMANEAKGAGKAAMMFGKWGYGIIGVIGATIISNWEAVKKALF